MTSGNGKNSESGNGEPATSHEEAEANPDDNKDEVDAEEQEEAKPAQSTKQLQHQVSTYPQRGGREGGMNFEKNINKNRKNVEHIIVYPFEVLLKKHGPIPQGFWNKTLSTYGYQAAVFVCHTVIIMLFFSQLCLSVIVNKANVQFQLIFV
jgi:hypothetical protein